MPITKLLAFIPFVFLISFLLPENLGFGSALRASIVAAEREASSDRSCMTFGEQKYFEEPSCPRITDIRWIYDGMKLSVIRKTYERDLLNDKINFGLFGTLIFFIAAGGFLVFINRSGRSRKVWPYSA